MCHRATESALKSLWSQSLQHPFDRTTPNAGKLALEFGAPELPLLENVTSSVLPPLAPGRFLALPSRQPESSSPLLPGLRQLEATGLQQTPASAEAH